MEDFEKKYNDALENIKTIKKANKDNKELVEFIEFKYPELKESEDDKIRKILIHIVKGACDNYGIKYRGVEITEEKLLAWLEKQGEHANFRNKIQIGDKVTRNEDGVLVNLSQLNRVAEPVEKQRKQKTADKVESRFKVGDWVRAISSGNMFKILSVNDGLCRVLCYDGVEANYPIENVKKDLAYWTIQDAKDGDVLASKNNCPFIYKKSDDTKARLYCCVSITNKFCIEDGIIHCGYKESVKPATKEQRDLLFSKMKEAGYVWDVEKKELKKIEQKPTEWSDRDWYYYSKLESFLEVKDHYSPTESSSGYQKDVHETLIWLKSLRPNKHVTWSEEDERNLEKAIECCTNRDFVFQTVEEQLSFLDWLKSIKERYTWKPSDEQMEILQYLCKTSSHPNEKIIPTLESLYQDLKKLTE